MDAKFWHEKWKSGEIGFHRSDVNPLLSKHFNALSLAKGSRVFLPLCGKSLDLVWLASKGCSVTGIELHEEAVKQFFSELKVKPTISAAEKLLRYSSGNITVFVGDIFDLSSELLGNVDAIYDRAAIVALPETMRKPYVSHLLKITHTAPQLVINYEYDQTVMAGPPFSVSNNEVQLHYQSHYKMKLLEQLDVAGGLKGKYPATESVWLLSSEE